MHLHLNATACVATDVYVKGHKAILTGRQPNKQVLKLYSPSSLHITGA